MSIVRLQGQDGYMYRSKDTICSVSLSCAFLCVYADLLFLTFFVEL